MQLLRVLRKCVDFDHCIEYHNNPTIQENLYIVTTFHCTSTKNSTFLTFACTKILISKLSSSVISIRAGINYNDKEKLILSAHKGTCFCDCSLHIKSTGPTKKFRHIFKV